MGVFGQNSSPMAAYRPLPRVRFQQQAVESGKNLRKNRKKVHEILHRECIEWSYLFWDRQCT